MGSRVFGPGSDFTINYIAGKSGFNSPKWKGHPCVSVPGDPEIDVQQPLKTKLVDGTAKKSFGTANVGVTGMTKKFTVKNDGAADLTDLAISTSGANDGDFIVTALRVTSLSPGSRATFTVTFKPTAAGPRKATIHISSNDADENPFDIKIAGMGATK